MNNLLLVNLQVSLNDLIHHFKHLLFTRLSLNLLVEVTGAELSDDVSVIFGGVNFMQCENIGYTLDFFKDFDLRFEESSVDLVFEHLHIDDFDSDRLL